MPATRRCQKILLIILLALAASGLMAQEDPQAAQPQLVISATDYLGKDTYTHHPYSELLSRALAQLGFGLTVVHNPGLRSLSMANNGLVDGELVRIHDISAEYPNLIRVPEPLGSSDLALYVAKQAAPASGQWSDFNASRLVEVKGLVIMDYLPARFTGLPQIRAQNYLQAIHLLVAGRADIAILPTSFVNKPENDGVARQLTLLRPFVGKVEGFTHLHKRHAALVEPLAHALREAKKSPTFPAHAPVEQ